MDSKEWALNHLRSRGTSEASLAAEWLAKNHPNDPEVLEALIEAIEDDSPLVREGVQIALRIIMADKLNT